MCRRKENIFKKQNPKHTHKPLHNMTLNSSLEIIIKLPNSRCVIQLIKFHLFRMTSKISEKSKGERQQQRASV
jgi:hypothetical protein